MLQILHLNALHPLAFVSLEEDVSCVSLYGFCVLITWLTKYGHDYRKWRQSPKEETWPKTKLRTPMDSKICWFEVIHSNHFVVKGLPPYSGAKALKKNVSPICHIQFQWKVTEHFWNRIKKMWIDRTKIALEKKVFWNKKFGDTFLVLICKTSYRQNLRAIEQIPFDL